MPSEDDERSAEDWLPEPESILVTFSFVPRQGSISRAPAPSGLHPAGDALSARYRILRTLEVDEYDKLVPAAAIPLLLEPRPAPSDNAFRGKSRRAAKLSVADADMEVFTDVKDLIATLPDHNSMMEHRGLSTEPDNNRVEEERRNARVGAFLYAASLENDRDYHLIIGRDPAKSPTYMTVEVSGLPPASSPHAKRLRAARAAYFEFFGDSLPGTSYDFYDPPIPVEIEGSLFFDFSHAEGSRPGPSKLRPKMPVVWEIHPVSKIVFEP
jgi:hypothetical protein